MNKEKKEIELFLGRSKTVLTTRFFGFKKKWKLRKMTLGRMLMLAEVYVDVQVTDESLNEEDLAEQLAFQNKSIIDNVELCSKAIAIAVKSRIPIWILKRHFKWNVDAKELQEIVYEILQSSNYANFMLSTFLMNGSRITKPKKVE